MQSVSFVLLQIELAKVKQQKIPSGWAADASGKVGIYLFSSFAHCFSLHASYYGWAALSLSSCCMYGHRFYMSALYVGSGSELYDFG